MNETFDVIVVGAGVAGCLAAIRASKGGAKTVVLEKGNDISDRPHREFLIVRDADYLHIADSNTASTSSHQVVVTGSKNSFEFDYPEDLRPVWMAGNNLVSALTNIVKSKPGICFRNSCEVKSLLQCDGIYHGVELSNGEHIYSRMIILCCGLHKNDFQIPVIKRWPRELSKFMTKIKVSTRINANCEQIKVNLQDNTYWFFTRAVYDSNSIVPFNGFISYEAQYADISEDEAVTEAKAFLKTNAVAKRILENIDVDSSIYISQKYDEFGVRLPASFPGLLIAGDSLNISGPLYLYGIYPSIYTSCLAGEMSGALIDERDMLRIRKYDDLLKENLVELQRDFDIIENSQDYFDASMKFLNCVMEDHKRYYFEVKT